MFFIHDLIIVLSIESNAIIRAHFSASCSSGSSSNFTPTVLIQLDGRCPRRNKSWPWGIVGSLYVWKLSSWSGSQLFCGSRFWRLAPAREARPRYVARGGLGHLRLITAQRGRCSVVLDGVQPLATEANVRGVFWHSRLRAWEGPYDFSKAG